MQGLYIDDRRKIVLVNGAPVRLSAKEFDLLKLLASDRGRVFSSTEIIERVWRDSGRATRSDVRQAIYLLRRRIENDPHDPRWILTVKGFGYALGDDAGDDEPRSSV